MHSPAGGRPTVKSNGLRVHDWEKKNVFSRGKETGLIKGSFVWLGLSQLLVFFFLRISVLEKLYDFMREVVTRKQRVHFVISVSFLALWVQTLPLPHVLCPSCHIPFILYRIAYISSHSTKLCSQFKSVRPCCPIKRFLAQRSSSLG